MRERRDSGLTAVELVVVIMVLGIGAAVTVPAVLRGGRNDRLARCEANLRELWKADSTRPKGLPFEPGASYWGAVVHDIDELACPLSNHARYRGPASNPATLRPADPIGADALDSHGPGEGGNVLLKNGEVRASRERDGLWKLAAERLAP